MSTNANPSEPETEMEVLVTGAGPVGLAMACELRRHGVPCRIIDPAGGPTDQSRALAVQARTMEVFRDMGIADKVLAQARRVHGLSAYADRHRIVHVSFDLDDLDTAYPFITILPQGRTERLLIERLADFGTEVERGARLAALVQDETGVNATLADAEGRERTVRARWLVGCDGPHSTVRHQLGLTFEGAEYPETFFLADVQLDWNRPDDEAQMFLIPGGAFIAFPFPEPGRWRIVDASETVMTDEPAEAVARLQALLDVHAPKGSVVSDPTWTALFRVHRRIVPNCRRGRCFVAGDAAHIHSPAGGQGMNTGIQDAHNLAWKLALVVKGDARESLLDSYNAEREPVAKGVMRGSDLATRAFTLRGPIAEKVRNRLASLLTDLGFVQRRLSRGLSELAVNYRKSPIVAEDRGPLAHALWPGHHAAESPGLGDYLDFGAAPHPGDRAPDVLFETPGDAAPKRLFDVLRETRHVLLLFEGATRSAEAQRAFEAIAALVRDRHAGRIVACLVAHLGHPPEGIAWDGPILRDGDGALHHRFGARAECLYLIRPDRFIGYRSQPASPETLRPYLDRLFVASVPLDQ